jgi:hypothetical protein
VLVALVPVLVGRVLVVAGLGDQLRRQQLHPAPRAMAGRLADHLRVHRAGVGGRPVCFGRSHVHLGDEREALVGLGLQVGHDALPLGRHVRVGAQDLELLL